jgi:hypothetical protein
MRIHAGQLEDCLRTTGVSRGALVYMTLGTVRWVGAQCLRRSEPVTSLNSRPSPKATFVSCR